MSKIIISSLAILILVAILLVTPAESVEDNLVKRVVKSKTYIEIQKSSNEYVQRYISKYHHKRDSIRQERTKHIFDYSFQKKYIFPHIDSSAAGNDSFNIYRTKFEIKDFLLFKKLALEFPELNELSQQTRLYVFQKAGKLLCKEHKELFYIPIK